MRENDGGMNRDKMDDRKGITQRTEGMKEDGLIFNNVMSWEPFSFLASVAINNTVSEIKWLCMNVHESICFLFFHVCLFVCVS